MSPIQGEQVTINSRRFDGSIRRSWNCELIESNATSLVFVGVFEFDVSHPDLGEIARGTISYEYYWFDRWYNIFCFYEPDGTFRNHYCNINMPPAFRDGALDYVDLDIDVVVWPDDTFQVLDEAEFKTNALEFGYPPSLIQNVSSALATVVQIIHNKELPRPK